MTSMLPNGFLLLALASHWAPQDVRPLAELLSKSYQSSQESLSIRGTVVRRKLMGEAVQETEREYRLVQGPQSVRVDICTASSDRRCGVYLHRDQKLLLYLPGSRTFASVSASDPGGTNILEAISGVRLALYGRIVAFVNEQHEITFSKDEDLNLRGKKVPVQHVKFRPVGKKKGWNAEAWIERPRGIVLRSKVVMQGGPELTEESFTLVDLKTGNDVPISDLEWMPPEGATRMERLPSGPLVQ